MSMQIGMKAIHRAVRMSVMDVYGTMIKRQRRVSNEKNNWIHTSGSCLCSFDRYYLLYIRLEDGNDHVGNSSCFCADNCNRHMSN